VSALILATAVRSCFGDGPATWTALIEGRCGARDIVHGGVSTRVYPIDNGPPERRAEAFLKQCLRELPELPPGVPVIVGTGLGQLAEVEQGRARALDFDDAVREVLPRSQPVTLSNACSAGAHALALALDRIEAGAEVVVAAGVDCFTAAMLAMNLRVSVPAALRVRPFDSQRRGALLGEGAVAIVLARRGQALGRLLSVGLSCDAGHPTAPDPEGIQRALASALERAGVEATTIDLVVAHGTGTRLNGRIEADFIEAAVGTGIPVTAIKGALGHTSGSAALHALDVALRCIREGLIPAIAGLRDPDCDLDLVRQTRRARPNIALVNAFGFGGVNALSLVSAP
jgi:3-oxoacyl-[acyl-carrier-protein] synthase II